MPGVQNSTAFNHVKKKLGKWEGKLTQGLTGAVYDASYEFELTSGEKKVVVLDTILTETNINEITGNNKSLLKKAYISNNNLHHV